MGFFGEAVPVNFSRNETNVVRIKTLNGHQVGHEGRYGTGIDGLLNSDCFYHHQQFDDV
jgi:hypothetical protein